MAAPEFGLPGALLFPPLDPQATGPIEQTTSGDAFLPTGLLLEQDTPAACTGAGESSHVVEQGFGGT